MSLDGKGKNSEWALIKYPVVTNKCLCVWESLDYEFFCFSPGYHDEYLSAVYGRWADGEEIWRKH